MAPKRFQLTALYPNTPLERVAEVVADDAQQAMVKALLERRVPAAFMPDKFGWLQPVFWHPELAGQQRWPRVVARNELAWGDGKGHNRLRFLIRASDPDERA